MFKTFIVIICLAAASATAWAHACSSDKNKSLVLAFYQKAFFDHKPQEAADKFLGDKYIQHNPHVADGKKPFVDFFTPFFKAHPDHHVAILKVVAEENLVFLHVHSQSDKNDRGRAVVDIFRVENGKIVEHWDVVQDVPEKAENTNTMF